MDSHNVDLKRTVNLPRTGFPDEGQPAAGRAENARAVGEGGPVRADSRRARRPAACTSCTTARPTPTAASTSGTAFNKILKDFIVKSKTMAGFDSPYVPGWDCHGLPIEIKVDSELGSKKAQMTAGRDPRAPAASTPRSTSICSARISSASASSAAGTIPTSR